MTWVWTQGHDFGVQVKSTIYLPRRRVIQLERAGPEAEEVSVGVSGFFCGVLIRLIRGTSSV